MLPKYTISNKINNKTHVCLINNETAYATYVWKYTNTNGQAHVPSRLLSGADEKRAQQDIDIQNTHTQCGWDLRSGLSESFLVNTHTRAAVLRSIIIRQTGSQCTQIYSSAKYYSQPNCSAHCKHKQVLLPPEKYWDKPMSDALLMHNFFFQHPHRDALHASSKAYKLNDWSHTYGDTSQRHHQWK